MVAEAARDSGWEEIVRLAREEPGPAPTGRAREDRAGGDNGPGRTSGQPEEVPMSPVSTSFRR